MAKIDTSKIEGYSTMTPEQKIAALEALEYEDHAAELERYKSAVSKANSEAAEWKRKHNDLLSEEDRKKQERDEEFNSMKEELEQLKKDKLIASHKAEFLALGYDDALATETAQAMADGDAAKVFANQKRFLESHDKAYKAQLMGDTYTPPAGNPAGGKNDFKKMIEEAQAAGDFAAAAYYTRLSEQEKQNGKGE